MLNAAMLHALTGQPVRIAPANMMSVTMAAGNHVPLAAVDPRKSAASATINLWGAGGGNASTYMLPGCGASVSGADPVGSWTYFRVGDVGADGAQSLFGAGRGGQGIGGLNGSGGGGTGFYIGGALIAVAGGGGGASNLNSMEGGVGGDAGKIVANAGAGGEGHYYYTAPHPGPGHTYGGAGTLSSGGAGADSTPSSQGNGYLGGAGGGAGGDGSGGGGGAYCVAWGGTQTPGGGGSGGADGADSYYSVNDAAPNKGFGGKGRNNATAPGDGGQGACGGGGGYGGGGGGGYFEAGGGGGSDLVPPGWTRLRAQDDVNVTRGTAGDPNSDGKAIIIY